MIDRICESDRVFRSSAKQSGSRFYKLPEVRWKLTPLGTSLAVMIFNSAQRRGHDNKPPGYPLKVHLNRKETTPMNKALLTILLFAFIVLFITAPFAGLAMLMFVVLGAAFISTFWNLVQALIGNAPKEPL